MSVCYVLERPRRGANIKKMLSRCFPFQLIISRQVYLVNFQRMPTSSTFIWLPKLTLTYLDRFYLWNFVQSDTKEVNHVFVLMMCSMLQFCKVANSMCVSLYVCKIRVILVFLFQFVCCCFVLLFVSSVLMDQVLNIRIGCSPFYTKSLYLKFHKQQ